MRKPKRDADVERTYVQLRLYCARCQGKIGNVFRMAGQHPEAGKTSVDARCSPTFYDRRDGGLTLTVVCSRCGAKPQQPWENVETALDTLRHDGDFRGSLTI